MKRRWALAAACLGFGLYALAAARGYAWEMLWLPVMTVGVAWPYERDGTVRSCLHRARRQPGRGR